MKDVKDRNQKGKTQGVQGKASLNPDDPEAWNGGVSRYKALPLGNSPGLQG